jgi:hypothetical protein
MTKAKTGHRAGKGYFPLFAWFMVGYIVLILVGTCLAMRFPEHLSTPYRCEVGHQHSDDDAEFGFVKGLYFSTVTITTLGYGEIHPATDPARLVVSIFTLSGIVVLGAFLTALGHKWSTDLTERPRRDAVRRLRTSYLTFRYHLVRVCTDAAFQENALSKEVLKSKYGPAYPQTLTDDPNAMHEVLTTAPLNIQGALERRFRATPSDSDEAPEQASFYFTFVRDVSRNFLDEYHSVNNQLGLVTPESDRCLKKLELYLNELLNEDLLEHVLPFEQIAMSVLKILTGNEHFPFPNDSLDTQSDIFADAIDGL